MRIRINIDELKKTVSDMDIIMKGNSLRMLDSLLVTAKDDKITVTANNLNMKVSKTVPGDVLIGGSVLLHRDDMAMLLKMKQDVILEFSGHQCTAEGNRLFRFVVTEDADDFPEMPEALDAKHNFTIPENELLYCLKLKKLMSVSKSEQIRGIWIDKNNLYACDGVRLGLIETEYFAEKRFMLTDFVVNYMMKALDRKSASPVLFNLSEKGIVSATSKSFEITYRQYDCDYALNYDMFDTSSAQTAVISKQDLTNTLGFMCEVYKSSHRGGSRPIERVIYSFLDSSLKLAYATSGRYVEEVIPVEQSGTGVDFQIAFQPVNNYELLSMVDGDEITMSFERPNSPSVIYGEKKNEKFLMLPVRMENAA